MSYYTNMAGQRFELPEQALEPPDRWDEEQVEPCAEEYDRWEAERSGRADRCQTAPGH